MVARLFLLLLLIPMLRLWPLVSFGRTAQQVAEVHERETLERDLHSVHGASVPVAASVATEAHVPTGKIDQATRAVGEVVETKTKERDVEAIHGAAPTAVAHKTHVEGVDTGVVAAGAKEVGEVVETHTTSRDMHNAVPGAKV